MSDEKTIETKLNDILQKLAKTQAFITLFDIAIQIGVDYRELKVWISDNKDNTIRNLCVDLLNNSLYVFSFKNKITAGINKYISDEIISDEQINELKVIVDINEYQKVLQPFTINNETDGIKEITNERDQIEKVDNVFLENIGIELMEEEEDE